MNKSDFIKALSEETSFTKKEVNKLVDAFKRVVERTLRQGDKVALSGFGTFDVSRRGERRGINPSTKERITLSATVVPKFKAGKGLKETVRELAHS